jgi:hypothetical protein
MPARNRLQTRDPGFFYSEGQRRCDHSVVANENDERALRKEAQAWAAFWRDSHVKDRRIDEETINLVLLRYYNAGITEEEMDQLAREAGVEPYTRGNRHPVARIEHDGKSAEIDEEIAPLVLELWRANLWTVSSCQDVRGRVHIDFADWAAAEAFVNLVVGERSSDVESLYSRIVVDDEPDDWEQFRRRRVWEFGGGRPIDYAATGQPDLGFWCVAVMFPRNDLELVFQRVRDFNAASA